MADTILYIFNILIFPGFLFVGVFGLMAEYVDRKLYAKLQNRMGPPWFQPFADFIKLIAKETIIPTGADEVIFKLMPVIAVTSTLAAFFYIPIWRPQALSSFYGDLIVVLYLLTIPTLTFFLGGWYSRSVFSMNRRNTGNYAVFRVRDSAVSEHTCPSDAGRYVVD